MNILCKCSYKIEEDILKMYFEQQRKDLKELKYQNQFRKLIHSYFDICHKAETVTIKINQKIVIYFKFARFKEY